MQDGSALETDLGVRRTASDLAFVRLRQAIINGELRPDERLIETQLAGSLQISRTPLRQALQRLETEGWIRRTSTGAIRVGGVSDHEIDALYDVRLSLECLALSEAVRQVSDSDVVNLTVNLAGQKRALAAGDFSTAADLSEAFHQEIWQLSRNNVCQEFLETINNRTKRYRRIAFEGQDNIGQGVTEHEKILKLIASRDAGGAQKLLAVHIEHSRTAVKSAFLSWKRKSH